MTENERVKIARKALKMTCETFGEKLGVGKTAISRIERGDRNVTPQMSKAICREFNVNPVWLDTGQGDMFMEPTMDDMELSEELLKPENKQYLDLIRYCKEVFDDKDWEDIIRLIKKSYRIVEQLESNKKEQE